MIGVFDSGVGGLTVLSAMRKAYPSIDAVYFGDTHNAPYGTRSREEITALTVDGIRFLQEKGATTIVSACNSVSVLLAVSIFDVLSLAPSNLIEMVGPCVSHFKGKADRIALCATSATIESGMYQNAFRMIGKEIEAVAIPGLAGAIEAGSEHDYESMIHDALAAIPENSYDTLVLACTHYPLVRDVFLHVVPHKVIYDPAEAVAERVLQTLWPREMGYGTSTLYISKESEQFRRLAAQLFPGEELTIAVARPS